MPLDRRRLGSSAALTPEQLEQAAEVTPVDVAAARALWQQSAPLKMTDLLEAVPIDDG